MAADIEVIWVRREQEYFCERGWTAEPPRSPTGKSINCRSALPSARDLLFATPPRGAQKSGHTGHVSALERERINRGVGERPLWCVFRTRVGHHAGSEKSQHRTYAAQQKPSLFIGFNPTMLYIRPRTIRTHSNIGVPNEEEAKRIGSRRGQRGSCPNCEHARQRPTAQGCVRHCYSLVGRVRYSFAFRAYSRCTS
jgi:hypothetical protein